MICLCGCTVTGALKQLKQLKQQKQQKQQKHEQQKHEQQEHEQQEPVVDSAPYVRTDEVWMGWWGWVSGTVCGMDAALRAYRDVLAAGPGNPPPPAHFQAIHLLPCF